MLWAGVFSLDAQDTLSIPYLIEEPLIDGDIGEWKEHAFHDGPWDLYRVINSPWYESSRNRLTLHPGESSSITDDLTARYYIAWDSSYLYLGAMVQDNFIDLNPSKPESL